MPTQVSKRQPLFVNLLAAQTQDALLIDTPSGLVVIENDADRQVTQSAFNNGNQAHASAVSLRPFSTRIED